MSTSSAFSNFNKYPIAVLCLTFILTACGGGGSETTAPVIAQATIITCDSPLDGAILSRAPGMVSLTGSVKNPNGVSSLQLNSGALAFDSQGSFSTQIPATWGMNFVNLTALDTTGHQTNHTCSFLLSADWAPDDTVLPSTISFGARQPALDTFAGVILAVLNSSQYRSDLETTVKGPIKIYSGCYDFVLFCTSYNLNVLVTKAQYGTVNSTLNLQGVSLKSWSGLNNIQFALKITGDVSGLTFDIPGSVGIAQASIYGTLTNGVMNQLVANVTDVQFNNVTVNVSLGLLPIALKDFLASLINDAINFLLNSFRSTISTIIAKQLTDWLATPFHDAAVNKTFPAKIPVPRLDSATSFDVNFSSSLSTEEITLGGVLDSLGTQFQVTPANNRPTLGAPIPSGDRLLDVSTIQPIGAAMHSALLNQAFYALWRGGYFDVNLGGGTLGGAVPANASVVTSAELPPAVRLRDDGRVEVALGALNIELTDPDLLTEPVTVGLSGRVSCALVLSGNNLLWNNCTVDEFHLSPDGFLLDESVQPDIEQLLTDVLDNIVASAGSSALPALPIPSYPLPTGYGFLPGSTLGMVNPALSISGDHLVLQGGLGLL